MKSNLMINADWDSEARVWVAESVDVPGLVTEAENMEQLIKKLKILIPELLELNKGVGYESTIPFSIASKYSDTVYG